jgi:exopolysaccharide biosynthesis protein
MKPAVILGVRYSEDDDKFRAVIDVAEPTPFFAVASPKVISVGLVTVAGFVPPNKATVRRDSRGQLIDEGPPKLITLEAAGGVLGSGVTIENTDRTFVRISAYGKYGVDAPRFYTLAGPDRIVLDFPKRWERTSVADVGQGIQRTWFSFGTPAGPVVAYALLAHVGPGGPLRARVALAGDVARTRAPLSRIASSAGALAGVNGGYFAPDSGDPIGLLIRDGEWIRMPYARRTALVIGQDGRLSMGGLGAQAEVNVGGRRYTVSGINEWLPGEGECVKVVTPRWGGSWPCISGQVCLQVGNGAVTAVAHPTGNEARQDVSVPADGFLVTGCGTAVAAALGAVRNGTTVTFAAALDPALSGVRDVLGAGPRLVAGGSYQNTSAAEQFKTDITVGRSPRTGVGITASGDLLLAVVDGRQPGYSVGMTQAELATLMIRLGAVDAMAMDSGGSAQMYADGRILNSPSDGRERPIPNALVVVPAGR